MFYIPFKNKRIKTKNLKLTRCCGSGKCKPSYMGGQENKYSIAWANQRISRINVDSRSKGYSALIATAEELLFMFRNSHDRCNACKRKRKPLCIDHCHKTGLLRGLLCRQCNTALGSCGESERVWNGIKRYMNKVVLQQPLNGVLVGREG